MRAITVEHVRTTLSRDPRIVRTLKTLDPYLRLVIAKLGDRLGEEVTGLRLLRAQADVLGSLANEQPPSAPAMNEQQRADLRRHAADFAHVVDALQKAPSKLSTAGDPRRSQTFADLLLDEPGQLFTRVPA